MRVSSASRAPSETGWRTVAPSKANFFSSRFPEDTEVGSGVVLVQERRTPSYRKASQQRVALMIVNTAIPLSILLITDTSPHVIAARHSPGSKSHVQARLTAQGWPICTGHLLS